MTPKQLNKIKKALESGEIDLNEISNNTSESEKIIMEMSKFDYNYLRDWYVTI